MKDYDIPGLVQNQKKYFYKFETKDPDFRIRALERLKDLVTENEGKISEALWSDLHKSRFESYETEIGIVLEELSNHIRNLKRWARASYKITPMALMPSICKVMREPFGTVLIISPWNYPFNLLINPLIGAISAGNTAVLKPSPYTPAFSDLIEELIEKYFPPEYITVVNGDRTVNQKLLQEKFDYIFFTGSPKLGKIVMKAAAEHLTPVTLELGGKSPCIVDHDANLKTAAKRIVWGKYLNAGQTCIAPDYLFAHSNIKSRLLGLMKQEINNFFGSSPKDSPDFPRVVSNEAFERLSGLLGSGRIAAGGDTDCSEKYIAPTILDGITPDDEIMQEEIFGPLLPVMEFDNINQVRDYVNSHPKPLAFYYFTEDKKKAHELLRQTSSGGACINDTIIHIGNSRLPFGGVGNSGMGKYHGRLSFETFSNMRSVVSTPTWIDIPIKYPPYKNKISILKKVLK
ncbi:MAG: aldehyde dehydrogenase [Bacteroidota bacterium]